MRTTKSLNINQEFLRKFREALVNIDPIERIRVIHARRDYLVRIGAVKMTFSNPPEKK